MKTSFVTYLHETNLMSRFLHVEFNLPHFTAQYVLQIGENQKSILDFYPKLWNFENSEKHQILKYMIMRKRQLKKKNYISTSFEQTFKIAKTS